MKHSVDKLSKSTYPSPAPITVFIISGLQSVIERILTMCDEFLMGSTLLTAFVYLCLLFSGILVHLVATLTGYVDILLNGIVFLLEYVSDNLLACSMASMR